ncbi:unnamed protein product [Wickerhamomyces anomalus]
MSASYFKCNSCAIQFPNSDSQRFHMKSDWHRYNLKRRVAQLPPVDAHVFAEKLQQSKQHEEERDEFGFAVIKPKEPKKLHIQQRVRGDIHRGRPVQVAGDIERAISPASTVASEFSSFSLGDSVYSHPGTHSDIGSDFEEIASQVGTDPSYVPSGDEDEDNDETFDSESHHEEPLQPITSCIYCGIPHHDVETNMSHMFKNHGLYIPERTYLVNLEGLLEYLISVIVIDNECLCCNFQGRSLESIRAHMSSKGHCRLPYESKLEREEFARFYDFSSIETNPEKSKSSKKVGFSGVDEETDEIIVDESSDSDDANDNYTLVHIDPIDSNLSLPNGNRLGHRQFRKIYRQNLPLPREPSQGQLTVSSADRRFAGGLTLPQQQKEDKAIKMFETKQKSTQIRREVKRINFQPHYRDPMLGG